MIIIVVSAPDLGVQPRNSATEWARISSASSKWTTLTTDFCRQTGKMKHRCTTHGMRRRKTEKTMKKMILSSHLLAWIRMARQFRPTMSSRTAGSALSIRYSTGVFLSATLRMKHRRLPRRHRIVGRRWRSSSSRWPSGTNWKGWTRGPTVPGTARLWRKQRRRRAAGRATPRGSRGCGVSGILSIGAAVTGKTLSYS